MSDTISSEVMIMDKKLFDILACPVCKGKLVYKKDQQALWCRADKLSYPIQDGVPILKADCAKRLSLEELDNG